MAKGRKLGREKQTLSMRECYSKINFPALIAFFHFKYDEAKAAQWDLLELFDHPFLAKKSTLFRASADDRQSNGSSNLHPHFKPRLRRGPNPIGLTPTNARSGHQQHIHNSVSNQYSLNKQCSASNLESIPKHAEQSGCCG